METIKWNGDNWDKFRASFPKYIQTDTAAHDINTLRLHIFTNIGIIYCNYGNFLVFPPKELIKYYNSKLKDLENK